MENNRNKKLGALLWLSELFRRYYENQATAKESQVVQNWDPEKTGRPNLSLLQNDEGTEEIWQSISAELGFETKRRRRITRRYAISSAAAVVLVLIGTGLYFGSFKQQRQLAVVQKTYFDSEQSITQLNLPDGTVIKLNNDSRFAIVEADFNKQRREVWLEEGEAFFEVAKDPARPFIVHTQNMTTTVKGTSFNIKSYKELDDKVLSVRSGKVEVKLNDTVVGLFTRNNRMTYSKVSQKVQREDINWEDAAAWTEYRLVLRRANAKELKLRLKQQYGVSVEIKGKALENTLLNASFNKDASLKEVLLGISTLYNIKYTISKEKVVLY